MESTTLLFESNCVLGLLVDVTKQHNVKATYMYCVVSASAKAKSTN